MSNLDILDFTIITLPLKLEHIGHMCLACCKYTPLGPLKDLVNMSTNCSLELTVRSLVFL